MNRDRLKDASSESAGGLRPWSKDWKQYWNEPLSWPRRTGRGRWDTKTHSKTWKAIHVDPSQSALVLVDVDKEAYDMYIEDFGRYDPVQGKRLRQRIYQTVVPNTIRLVDFFRSHERPVIFIQWDWHRYQYPPLEPLQGEPVVYKSATGAFNASRIDAVLRRSEISTVFFLGADTSFCLESTVRGAVDCAYRAIVVEDGCVSCLQQLHDSTLLTLGWHLAFITTTSQVIEHYPWENLHGVAHPLQGTQ